MIFLFRNSLRDSKKLQALQKQVTVAGHANGAFVQGESSPDSAIHSSSDQQPVVALEDVLLSVNRLVGDLDKIPEHRSDAEFLRNLFGQTHVQNAARLTGLVQAQLKQGRPSGCESFAAADATLQQLLLQLQHSGGGRLSAQAEELQWLLEQPNFQALLYTHDKIGTIHDHLTMLQWEARCSFESLLKVF